MFIDMGLESFCDLGFFKGQPNLAISILNI